MGVGPRRGQCKGSGRQSPSQLRLVTSRHRKCRPPCPMPPPRNSGPPSNAVDRPGSTADEWPSAEMHGGAKSLKRKRAETRSSRSPVRTPLHERSAHRLLVRESVPSRQAAKWRRSGRERRTVPYEEPCSTQGRSHACFTTADPELCNHLRPPWLAKRPPTRQAPVGMLRSRLTRPAKRRATSGSTR
jgi:hypothetical protein